MCKFSFFGSCWGTKKEKEELEKKYQQLLAEKLDEQAAQYLKDLSDMATSLAHEIRNPLASIRAGAQRIEQKISSADPNLKGGYLKYAQFIIREVDRLERLVRDLLQDMRLFAQRQKPDFQMVDLNCLLEEIISILGDEMNRQGIELKKNSVPSLRKTHLDPQLMTQVVLNLVRNSVDALGNLPAGNKEICFSIQANEKHLEIKVSDNGPGVPEELKEKIFQPFFSTKQQGTGLGLAICRRIVEAQQGKIFLEPHSGIEKKGLPGQGATFVIQLPRH